MSCRNPQPSAAMIEQGAYGIHEYLDDMLGFQDEWDDETL